MPLVDGFGREVDDLRISVTKRCNFSCIYCHNEGLGPIQRPRAPHPDEMTPIEIERVVRVAHELGVRSLHFTGGEALLRSDLEEIVARSARHVTALSLTTNGSLLAPRAEALREAGLRRVNVSIDSLDPEAFRSIRGASLKPVLRGIRTALEVGLAPVKLNMVVLRHTLPFIPQMLEFVRAGEGLTLQLIQFMPELVGHEDWMVDIDALKAWLARQADRVEVRHHHNRRIYRLNGARVEVVDPVYNREFCANCHRVRLTPDGRLKGCLNRSDDLVPVRGLDAAGIRTAFRKVVAQRVPYYGAYVEDFPERDRDAAPLELRAAVP